MADLGLFQTIYEQITIVMITRDEDVEARKLVRRDVYTTGTLFHSSIPIIKWNGLHLSSFKEIFLSNCRQQNFFFITMVLMRSAMIVTVDILEG